MEPATPQREETTTLLAPPHSSRTKLLLEQLSQANQTLANQNDLYRTGKSPWSAAQAAAQAATRFASSVSPLAPPLDVALAAARTTAGDSTPGPPTVDTPGLAEGNPGRPRRETPPVGKATRGAVVAENVTLKLFVVVEQAADLPIMDLLSSDPYLKVWHQESTPPQQPDSHMELSPHARKLSCTTSSGRIPPVEFKSTSLTHLGQSPYVRESLNPIWRFRVEHEITLRPGQLLDKGWLVVEIWDYDRVGKDDPMGRLDIALEEQEVDVVIDKWYKLGWVPGQTHPGPGEKSRVNVRLLVSSLPHGLSRTQQWMVSSYDFVELQEIITAYQYKTENQAEDRAVIARCEWHLHEIVSEAFATFDVNGDGFIQPAELMHVMSVLGEEMDQEEIAGMIAECKAWGQPCGERLENGQVARSSVDSQQQVFSPLLVEILDFTKSKSGKSQACISAQEFHNMLTVYWCCRKYGSKCHGAANDVKFQRVTKWGLKDRAGASPAAKYIELNLALDQASVQAMPPVVSIVGTHNRASTTFRSILTTSCEYRSEGCARQWSLALTLLPHLH